jgi:hypothetical protein
MKEDNKISKPIFITYQVFPEDYSKTLPELFFSSTKLAFNVLGIRRFAVANKGFAKQRPATVKCGWKEAWECSVAE